MIPVDSFLEIYTALFAWGFYTKLWSLISETGMILIPLIGAIWLAFFVPMTNPNEKAAPLVSIYMMREYIASFLAILILFGIPVYTVIPTEISFNQRVCTSADADPTYTKQNYGNTGTTYDAKPPIMASENSPRIPIMWAVLYRLAAGINHYMAAGMPCFEDARSTAMLVRSSVIRDPAIREQYNRFASFCYVPAYSKYMKAISESSLPPAPVEDIQYIGSRFFLETEGFYKECPAADRRASGPCLSGSQYVAAPPGWEDRANTGLSCREWWLDTDRGLREMLLTQVDVGEKFDGWSHYLTSLDWMDGSAGGLEDQREWASDLAIQNLLLNGPPEFTGNRYDSNLGAVALAAAGAGGAVEYKLWKRAKEKAGTTSRSWRTQAKILSQKLGGKLWATTGGGRVRAAVSVAGRAGVGLGKKAMGLVTSAAVPVLSEAASLLAKIEMIKALAPMVQAVALMGMIMVMPFAFVVGGAQWRGPLTLVVVFLSIKFWTVLFLAANYLDHNLWNAMYPAIGARLSAWDTLMRPIDRTLFELLTGILYVLLPIMLSTTLGWAGWKVGTGIDKYMEDDITKGAASNIIKS